MRKVIVVGLSFVVGCAFAGGAVKRGVGSGLTTCVQHESLPHLSWYYNWGTRAANTTSECAQALGHEFVPMQWSKWSINQLEQNIPAHSTALLGFNEPNHLEQANLTPKEAASLWPTVEAAASKFNLRLGSPAAANCGGTSCITHSPTDWWDQWLGNCTAGKSPCKFDFLAVHYYSCNVDAFKSFLDECWTKYNRPIWVTEFCCPLPNGPLSAQESFMKRSLTMLEAHPHVERYAWFSTRTSGWLGTEASLLNADGTPTEIGKLYDTFATS
eukprot:TRINITY_DN665_c0_g4_i1.p1 TRINITY_DN665_c0_g4~~TRINITY_DN665_c0_g4_i1.p1  ORF type:complete len:271 (-),score=62.82 TRINITY_DN665_c0_g4_i1:332-1144(-)